ncbi:type II toxin-antitoxin system RelE/ParE family toxin [Apilactobacillus micheneri]|uniref:type II toxin-antitoxin system RelE/ParE family toxin n=1 Tax=Apilactobacillus micheneri TaxID=1899430 RepID=UPI001126D77D|nr:type II toxin-antitoxin system RelE/ParE family toxin [Apilactobacillus micheneri]TPR42311.1 type II toxin-antitoxin system RelE/ParE family toxin [Apilactobacillus micheneri]TPR47040.1 type II toxin-antitoxin system RelE/ParE family toxin [Apilactobacillus micheneri]
MKSIIFSYYDWEEFESFLDRLPVKDAVKLSDRIQKIEEYGLLISERQEWIKKLENNLYEIRSKRSSNIQRALYFKIVGNQFMISHAFTKKTNKTPNSEKNKARNRRDNYLRGHNNE